MRFAASLACLAALLCAAALFGAWENCLDLAGSAAYSLGYASIAALLIWWSAGQPRRVVHYCAAVFLVSLALRLTWGLAASLPATADDYGYYREVSVQCLHGNWKGLIQTFYPWGYILWLYALAKTFGPALWIPVTANAIVGSATTLLVYAAARHVCRERDARIAAGIYALWPGVIYWTSILCSEIPHLLFFLAALVCLQAGHEPRGTGWRWMAGGGVLAAIAEFIRPVSLALLVPFALYTVAFANGSGGQAEGRNWKKWLRPAPALGSCALCLAALLAAKSIATGYPNFSTSQTLGINLAHGLNWDTQGMYDQSDSKFWNWTDPRETNRVGIQLARQRLAAMWAQHWWLLPALAIRKFPVIWSLEEAGYDANFQGLTEAQQAKHWLAVYGHDIRALGQHYHALVLALAAVGFWRSRRSGSLVLLCGILVMFVLIHTVLEVDGRYHFALQPLLAVAAACALFSEQQSVMRRRRTHGA